MDEETRWDEIGPALEVIGKRLDHIEGHLEHLGRAVGYRYVRFNAQASSQLPPEVLELARDGKTLEAIKAYRAATGASLEDARAAVMGL
jgi:hypothetical protein